MNQYDQIIAKAQGRVKDLEKTIDAIDFKLIEPRKAEKLLTNQQVYTEVQALYQNNDLNQDQKQTKLYNILIKLVFFYNSNLGQIYEHKRLSRDFQENKNTLIRKKRDIDSVNNDVQRVQNSLNEKLIDLADANQRNSLLQEENDRKEEAIKSKKQEHQRIFQQTIDVITTRVKEYEQQAQQQGKEFQKYSHLQEEVIEKKKRVDEIIDEIDKIEKRIKDLQFQYKEQVKLELGDLNEQKINETQNYEIQKQKRIEILQQIEAFKKRFIRQKQLISMNKEKQLQFDKELLRTIEQKNYLEKENQEMRKNQENQDLIYQNLLEEVTDLTQEIQILSAKKNELENILLANMNK